MHLASLVFGLLFVEFLQDGQVVFVDLPEVAPALPIRPSRLVQPLLPFALDDFFIIQAFILWVVFLLLFGLLAFLLLLWFQILPGYLILPDMVHLDGTTTEFDAIQVVYSQDCASLVLVSQEGKALAFPCLPVTSQTTVDDFPVLAEDNDDVTLVHPVVKTADVDIS